MKYKLTLILSITLFIVSSCNNEPKAIDPYEGKFSKKKIGNVSEDPPIHNHTIPEQPLNNDVHTVTVNEVLQTAKYVYLNVSENGEEFWIATRKQKITVGGTYFYKGGLLKTNYESKEHNRVFEKIYLVTRLVQENHGNNSDIGQLEVQSNQQNDKNNSSDITIQKIEKEGSMKISELIKNYKNLEGKTVQISGRCVKINPNIMGKNWIHIKDGSNDDYDLVITSNTFVIEGSIITIRAVVSLNKDFGAGYKYELILENGIILP